MVTVIVPLTDGVLGLKKPGGVRRAAAPTQGEPYSRRLGVSHNATNAGRAPLAFLEGRGGGCCHGASAQGRSGAFHGGVEPSREWRFVGTDKTRKTVDVQGCDIFRFDGNLIALKDSYRKARTA